MGCCDQVSNFRDLVFSDFFRAGLKRKGLPRVWQSEFGVYHIARKDWCSPLTSEPLGVGWGDQNGASMTRGFRLKASVASRTSRMCELLVCMTMPVPWRRHIAQASSFSVGLDEMKGSASYG